MMRITAVTLLAMALMGPLSHAQDSEALEAVVSRDERCLTGKCDNEVTATQPWWNSSQQEWQKELETTFNEGTAVVPGTSKIGK